MEQLGMTGVKYFGGDALCTEKLPELSSTAGTLKNVTCATGGASVQKMQGGIAWKKKYDARFPGRLATPHPIVAEGHRWIGGSAVVLKGALSR